MTITTKAKYLINCQDGANNVERATISLILATTASKEHEAVIFLTSEAAWLSAKSGADGLVYEGMEPVKDLIAQFTGNGGKLWICPICAKLKNITEADLIEGASIAGAPKTMEFLSSGGQVLA